MTADERAVAKMLDLGLSLRNQLAEGCEDQGGFYSAMMADVETELAGLIPDLCRVRDQLRQLGDANGLALSCYADKLLSRYVKADKRVAAMLKRAGGRR